jgi:hypothetical protein
VTQQRIPYIIQLSASASAYTANPIIELDYRFAPDQTRTVCGSTTGSDTVVVLVSPIPDGQRSPTLLGASSSIGAHTDFFVTISSYSGVFRETITGPWARIAFTKTGTSGAASVYILG